MKFIEEYRDPAAAHALAAELARTITKPWTLMEVCGGQTHAILRFGIDRLLPPELRLIHGPGCPVCVTPAGLIDQAVTATWEALGSGASVDDVAHALQGSESEAGRDLATAIAPFCLNTQSNR